MPEKNFGGECASLLGELNGMDNGDIGPNEAVERSSAQSWADVTGLAERWRALNGRELTALNDLLVKHRIKPISAAPVLVDPPAPRKRFLPPPPP